jgi:hypothetical protein
MKKPVIYALLLATGLFIGNLWSSKAQGNFQTNVASENGRFIISRPLYQESGIGDPTFLLDSKTGTVFRLAILPNSDPTDKSLHWVWSMMEMYGKPPEAK